MQSRLMVYLVLFLLWPGDPERGGACGFGSTLPEMPFPEDTGQAIRQDADPVGFIVYGDIQGNYRGSHDELVSRMMREPCVDFLVNTGDISQDDGEGYETHFYPVIAGLAKRLPYFPSPGNHDVQWGSPWSRSRFRTFFSAAYQFLSGLPGNEHLREKPFQRLWYAFTWGGVLFVVLDSNLFIDEGKYAKTHSLPPYRNLKEEQLLWLESLLRQHRNDPAIRARFVAFHHSPIISSESGGLLGMGGHPGHQNMLCGLKMPQDSSSEVEYALDLFRVYGVNAVFSGHEHYYERWREILEENGTPIHTIHWIVNGLGGVKPRGRPKHKERAIGNLLDSNRALAGYLDRAQTLGPGLSSELQHLYPTQSRHETRTASYILVRVSRSEIRFVRKDGKGRILDQGNLNPLVPSFGGVPRSGGVGLSRALSCWE